MRAIGYREFFVTGEDGAVSLAENLAEVEALVARNSRHYAKRQITYFASLPHVVWVDIADEEDLEARKRASRTRPAGLELHAESVLRGLIGAFLKGDTD